MALTLRDISERYRGSLLGLGWAAVQPLVMLALYTFVFSLVLKVRFGASDDTGQFAIYLFCGMLPWTALNEGVTRSASVIIENRALVKKVVFPLQILPVKVAAAALMGQGVGTFILIAAIALTSGVLHPTALLAPVLLIPQLILTVALGWLVASVGVYVRDMGHIVTLVLTAWMFGTPIFYPASAIPERFAWILYANPAALLIEAYRDLLIEGAIPSFLPIATLTLGAAFAGTMAFAWFDRLRPSFADVL